jgi:hypothetical protein
MANTEVKPRSMPLTDHSRGSVLVTASPIRPSLLRFGAKACSFGPTQDGVKPRCPVQHTQRVDGDNTHAVFGTVTGPRGSVSYALSDAKNGVAIDELDVAERTCSAARFDPVRNSQN